MLKTRKLNVGVNDLATTHPVVANLWHTRNEMTAQQVTAGSERIVWWMNPDCGHEWEAPIANIVQKAKGCPYCSNRRILVGFNDLRTTDPELASMWNYERNSDLTPQDITSGSAKKVWWKCAEGHEWMNEIRVKRRCQVCAHRKVLSGYNDITVTAPDVASEFHPVKNNTLQANTILAGSIEKVWWLGKCNHEWETSPHSRIKLGSGCPTCVNQRILTGFNDLVTISPKLASEWNYQMNGNLRPEDVPIGTGKKVWWICSKNHTWKTSILNRKTKGCPYCSGNKVLKGFNDLLSQRPDIAAQWHMVYNIPLQRDQVSVGSNRKVWWICNKNHEWKAGIYFRTSSNGGCPECWNNTFISKPEQAIADFLVEHNIVIKQSDRKVLSGGELDIYVPTKNIAIEYNGLYWHSENQGKDRNYHYNKWLTCKALGIQLIQIWEDEWLKNPEQIKAMLLHKLGITQQEKVFARKTLVTQLSKTEIEAFLEEHHVQGYAAGSRYLGLREKSTNELVSVLVLKKEANNTLNIIRYATSKNVVGGFTKLLRYAELTYKPERFITFSDHCVSDGGLYASNGFIPDKELPPDYRYVVGGKREHKFGYRLKRFRNDPNLKYDDGLTERELAVLNSLPRIWDAGKTRWVKRINS